MSILSQLNSPAMYAICGGIVAFVALICIVFLIRAWRAGLAIGMDRTKMKRVIVSSATFSALPSVGILLGVIALSGSLGTPWPWLRLSVIGALHYETQVAQAAAEQVGMKSLSAAEMTPAGFATIALLMSLCIIWGIALSILLFILLPTLLAGLTKSFIQSPVVRNLFEGLLRIVIFLLYLWGVAHMKDVERMFAYHGAEHKTIFCYEKGLPLTVENVRPQSRFHPRCGTSFLFVVVIISILVFSLVSLRVGLWDNPWACMAEDARAAHRPAAAAAAGRGIHQL